MFEELALFVAVGFAAQLIDGAIGMAYGLFASSVLLGLGVPPATASASVHVAEVFTTGASGLAHWRMGNVRRDLVLRLAVPGALGGVLGAYALSAAPVGPVRVGVSLYLMGLGGLVLLKAAAAAAAGGAAAAAGRRARLLRRRARRHRRRRLGGDRHLHPDRARRRAAHRDRLGQPGGVLRHRRHLGHLHRGRRRVALARHPGAGAGRGAGRADRGAGGAAAAGPAADGGRGRGRVAAGAPDLLA
jgi:hypothetical protein